MHRLAVGIAILGITAVSVGVAPTSAPYTTIDEAGQPFKSRFNADGGKIRIVALVAPT